RSTIINGGRETPIDGTPVYFMNIYFDAWKGDPKFTKQEISNPVTILKLKQEIDSLREQLAKSWGRNRISLGTT
ncbi:20781_t:CDS:2, partial [Gigaspora rosea]